MNIIDKKSLSAFDISVGLDHLSLLLLDQMQDFPDLILADYDIENLLTLEFHEFRPFLLILLCDSEHLHCAISGIVVLNPFQYALVPYLELPLLDELVRVILLRVSLLT